MKYFTMHTGAIRNLLYGLCAYTGDNHSLKLVDSLPVQMHKPYNNLRINVIFLG